MSNRSGSPYSVPRDANHVPFLVAASTTDGITPVVLEADPTTHLLQVSSSGSGGGGTQYTQGGATVTNPTGNALIYFNGSNQPIAVTSSNPLPITGTISVGSTTDESAFTAGTSTLSPSGGVFNDSVANLTSGQQGTNRMTAARAQHINLRSNTGTEIGTTANPVQTGVITTSTASYPMYDRRDLGQIGLQTDGAGALQTFSEVTTDEGTGRANFTGTSISTSPGSATFTNGSAAVTGSGFTTVDLYYMDYIKLGTDAESAWAQVSFVNSDTSITLISAYTGTGGTGTYNLSPVATITGTGATISVASGQATLALGTNTTAATNLFRGAGAPPLRNTIFSTQASISQRVANQDIYIGVEAATSAPRYFSRFHFTGTTNTQVITETAYNPTTTPSTAETETNTITLPGSANTASVNTYLIVSEIDKVTFYINGLVVATHVARLPHVASQAYFGNLRSVNSGAVTNTNIVSNFIFLRNYERIDAPNNQSINVGQISGTMASVGNGATDNGTLRVSISSDSTGQVKLATGANTIGSISNTSFAATQSTAAALTAGWPTINGEAADVTGTFTNATQTTSVTANNLDGYGNTLISINGTYGTATAIFEGSDDGGTTWYTVQAARDNTNVIETGYTSQTNTSQTWQINNPGFDSLRIRSTAVASGTVNVRLSSSAAPVASGTIVGLGTSIPAGSAIVGKVGIDQTTPGTTNNIALSAKDDSSAAQVPVTTRNVNGSTESLNVFVQNANAGSLLGKINLYDTTNSNGAAVDSSGRLLVNLSPAVGGGWTPYFANAITTTVTPTSAAGKFGGYMLINLNSAPAYLQVFDTTGAVTLGSTAPTFVIPIPANATAANGLAANVELANGIVIANGIKCAATTTSNGATTVTTGLTGTLWLK